MTAASPPGLHALAAAQRRGFQWTNGGAGCAERTGVGLAAVLAAAGLTPEAFPPRAPQGGWLNPLVRR